MNHTGNLLGVVRVLAGFVIVNVDLAANEEAMKRTNEESMNEEFVV